MCDKVMRSDNLKRHEKICKMQVKPNDGGMKVDDLSVKKRKLENPIFKEKVNSFINKIIKDNHQSPHIHKQGEKKRYRRVPKKEPSTIKTYPAKNNQNRN